MSYVINCIPGTLQHVLEELRELIPQVRIREQRATEIIVSNKTETKDLLKLKTAPAVYKLLSLEVPRPKAFLGQENFNLILSCATEVLSPDFNGFRIDAAGKDSKVMQSFAEKLQTALNIPYNKDKGDLQIRIRKNQHDGVWDILFRLTPLPLSTRSWRKENFRGALDACIAACMLQDLKLQAGNKLCNLMLGSGTLLAEAYAMEPMLELVGVEKNSETFKLAQANLKHTQAKIILADATACDLPSNNFDYVIADLPWGENISTNEDLKLMYRNLLVEVSRILKEKAQAVFITQRTQEFSEVLNENTCFQLVKQYKVTQGGYSPSVYLVTN